MAVPLQSDVPTFLAPAHERLDYVPGSIVVRFHESAAEPLDYLEREAGAHTVENVGDDFTVVWVDDDAVSPELLRTVESSPAVAFAERMPARWLSAAEEADPRHRRRRAPSRSRRRRRDVRPRRRERDRHRRARHARQRDHRRAQ
jgi:hypothetical protein